MSGAAGIGFPSSEPSHTKIQIERFLFLETKMGVTFHRIFDFFEIKY